jgi:hypothetical protein
VSPRVRDRVLRPPDSQLRDAEWNGQFEDERQAIEEIFTPLVLKCKELGTAMRIGVNHGSLSARIMSYYGDSPAGMVASAVEFADICRKHDYHNFVFSMKASNPLVMAQGYRRLAAEMYKRDWDYPLHLGVTEASTRVSIHRAIKCRVSYVHVIECVGPAHKEASPSDESSPSATANERAAAPSSPLPSARRRRDPPPSRGLSPRSRRRARVRTAG